MQESDRAQRPGPSGIEAQRSLEEIEHRRQGVVDQIGVPGWYWLGLAGAWICLGAAADLGPAWLTFAATLAFCVGNSFSSHRYLGGRHRSAQVSVRDDVAGRRTASIVGATLFGLVGLTALAAVVVSADGASHPVLVASVIAAVILVVGGPRVMAAVRVHASARAMHSS